MLHRLNKNLNEHVLMNMNYWEYVLLRAKRKYKRYRFSVQVKQLQWYGYVMCLKYQTIAVDGTYKKIYK